MSNLILMKIYLISFKVPIRSTHQYVPFNLISSLTYGINEPL